MSLCYFSLLAGNTDCKGAQEPFQSLLWNTCSILTNPLFYHSQLSISPFPMKIHWFYFWYSVCSSSPGRCLPRPTTFMSFLPELDLSGRVLTTAWQTNRKRSPTELWSCSIFASIRKGLQHHTMLYKDGVVWKICTDTLSAVHWRTLNSCSITRVGFVSDTGTCCLLRTRAHYLRTTLHHNGSEQSQLWMRALAPFRLLYTLSPGQQGLPDLPFIFLQDFLNVLPLIFMPKDDENRWRIW